MSEIKKLLDAKIPREAVSQREAGNGVKLDYLSSYYVIARLNEVLGQGNWGYTINELKLVYQGEVEGKYGSVFSAHYLAQVALYATIDKRTVHFSEVGYGDGTDKKSPGKPHELAAKEAVTDAVKRCAKNLGMSLGLALYDKTQEYVENEVAQVAKKEVAPKSTTKKEVSDSKKDLKNKVRALDAGKKLTIPEFKVLMFNKFKVEKVDDLNVDQAAKLLTELQNQYQ